MTNNALGEEIAWLHGFGWSASRISERLDIDLATVQIVLGRMNVEATRNEREISSIAAGARREARLVYGRTSKEWKQNA